VRAAREARAVRKGGCGRVNFLPNAGGKKVELRLRGICGSAIGKTKKVHPEDSDQSGEWTRKEPDKGIDGHEDLLKLRETLGCELSAWD